MPNRWNHPDEEVSCPSCGKLYGHHKTIVCKGCEEYSACHKPRNEKRCPTPIFVDADTFVNSL